MKVVIDCNIIISAGLKEGLCRTVLSYVIENCDIYVSEATLKEYIVVSQRAKFSLSYDLLEKIIILFRRSAELVKVKELNIKLPDPSDGKYIDIAKVKQFIAITQNTFIPARPDWQMLRRAPIIDDEAQDSEPLILHK